MEYGILEKKLIAGLLRRDFYPVVKTDGFKRKKEVFHRINDPVVHVVQVRHRTVEQVYQVLMGVHLLLLGDFALDVTGKPIKDPTKLNVYDCAWTHSIIPGFINDTLNDWVYGNTEEEATGMIEFLISEWPRQSAAFFGPLTRWPDDFHKRAKDANKGAEKPHWRVLTWARVAALAGDFDLAQALAIKALPFVPEKATTYRKSLEQIALDPHNALPLLPDSE
ncbi:MAG: DUF4304 domain-containing protein [Planctomycetes bacterium]|nr:DUF4304 domain-containing protein [Planctomycetota bacterium]